MGRSDEFGLCLDTCGESKVQNSSRLGHFLKWPPKLTRRSGHVLIDIVGYSKLLITEQSGRRAPVASLMLSYGALKLFPVWDPLRGDPRFEKIVASLAPKDAK